MFATANFYTLLPFIMALALTHLLALPIKGFFMTGRLQDLAQRTTIANVVMVVYVILVFFVLGSNHPGTLWSTIKLIPVLVVAAYSLGIWVYLMVRGPRNLLLVDAVIFTVVAFAAS